MIEFSKYFYDIVIWLYLLYGLAVFLVYAWVGLYALGAVRRYKKQNTFTDYNIIAANNNAPSFSIIAPAFNEGITIVENVRSLLSLFYHKLEIIIVNDGSTDHSIDNLVAAYDLEAVEHYIPGNIPTQGIRNVYKSKNPAFRKLLVVDKYNGGKADALNVGINIATGDYLVCIDVDCILEQDSILKLAKPFLQETDKKVIACGGVIRLANNCKVINGKIVDVALPRTLLGKSQALEYIRAFVLGRMAWSRAAGLILISGAFGVFDRKIVLACGGYDKNTVGEDMELVVRMRRYMQEKRLPYQVLTIPDPLCWTEVPEKREILLRQRNRWMRGTMETLWKHRRLMFNPRYGKLGMVSLPYWLLFEFLGPLVEFSGYIIFIIFLLLGIISWPIFFILFALVLSCGFLYSIYAILIDLVSHQVYVKRKDFFQLIGTAFLEPFHFHLIVLRANVNGFFAYFRKSQGWGVMVRQGFSDATEHLSTKELIFLKAKEAMRKYAPLALAFIALFMIGSAAEWGWYASKSQNLGQLNIAVSLLSSNFIFALRVVGVMGLLYFLLYLAKPNWSNTVSFFVFTVLVTIQYFLFIYFSESRNLLGADIFYYSKEEMQQILQASGMISITNIALVVLLLICTILPLWIAAKYPSKKHYFGMIAIAVSLPFLLLPTDLIKTGKQTQLSEFDQNALKNKWGYFLSSNTDDFLNNHPALMQLWAQEEDMAVDAAVIDPKFPFWRKESTPDFLGSYFNSSEQAPNLVIIMLEGMGHAYSSNNGYVGDFTPFLSELKKKSLYWDQALSSAGRTFAAVPSITGSLPFAKNGFLEIKETPEHFNLFNVLKENGFSTGFYYGGNSSFDRIRDYLQYSKVDRIEDQYTFAAPDRKLPGNDGESWGYEDQAVFRKAASEAATSSSPYFNVVLTLSSHNPFLINDTSYFENLYNKRIASGILNEDQKRWALENKKQLISVLNADSALKGFFEAYQKRRDYKNTIFVITGDHAMPEITLQSKIDRFRVPLVIYSPLLKESKLFHNTVSHFDIAPSILAYYRENYNFATPQDVAWVGKGLSANNKRTTVAIPIMKSKNQLTDYVLGDYHLDTDQLFELKNMNENLVDQPAMLRKIKQHFDEYKRMNMQFYSTGKLLPPGTLQKFESR